MQFHSSVKFNEHIVYLDICSIKCKISIGAAFKKKCSVMKWCLGHLGGKGLFWLIAVGGCLWSLIPGHRLSIVLWQRKQ